MKSTKCQNPFSMEYQQSWPNIELNRIQMAVSSWTAQYSEKKRHKKAHIVTKQEVESRKKKPLTQHTKLNKKQTYWRALSHNFQVQATLLPLLVLVLCMYWTGRWLKASENKEWKKRRTVQTFWKQRENGVFIGAAR